MLFLHAGMAKTGTTTLQKALAKAETTLKEHGCLYPTEFRPNAIDAHHALALTLLSDPDRAPELLDTLKDALSHEGYDNVILSSEAMANFLNKRKFQHLGDITDTASHKHPVHWIMTLRRIDDFIESTYLHLSKTGEFRGDIQSYLEPRWYWFEEILEHVAKLKNSKGIAQVSLVEYKSDGSSNLEVLKILGLEALAETSGAKTERLNPRLGLKSQAFLLHLDGLCEGLALDLNKDWLRAVVQGGHFKFSNDIHHYDIISKRDRMLLHEIALRAAIQHGIPEYFDFFSGSPMTSKEFRELTPDVLEPSDLEELKAFLDSVQH